VVVREVLVVVEREARQTRKEPQVQPILEVAAAVQAVLLLATLAEQAVPA
jgi:hypothetical protein